MLKMPNSSEDSPDPIQLSESNQKAKTKIEEKAPIKSHSLRRLLVFQLKLAVDALRDILLSPVSIICTIIDFFE